MTKKGTHRIIPPAKRIQVIIGELAGLLAIITLVVECASYLQDRFTLNLEDSAQNTMVAVMDKQLELQSEIATFQASGVKSGPTASAAAQEMASLVGTLQVLETERRGPKATLTLNAPTTVPLATPTPKPTKISQPAPMPTCSAVVGPFAAVWQSVEVVVGCASSQVIVGLIAEEDFERGKMLWREPIDQAQALVLFSDGTWQTVEHAPYVEGSPEFSCPDANTPSECPPTPKRGFGMIWCDSPVIRSRLGNATDCERGYQGSMQQFERGFMLLSYNGAIFILYNDRHWEQYLSGPFADIWSDVQDGVGYATGPYTKTWVAEEAFENGWMYWRKDSNEVTAQPEGATRG